MIDYKKFGKTCTLRNKYVIDVIFNRLNMYLFNNIVNKQHAWFVDDSYGYGCHAIGYFYED